MAHNIHENMKSSNSLPPHPSPPVEDSDAARSTRMVRCDQCGHELPAANMALHRVTACGSLAIQHQHQHQQPAQHRNQQRIVPNGGSDAGAANTTNSTTQQQPEATFQCPTCGKHVSTLSATVHDATCHRRQPPTPQQNDENDNNNAMEEEEAVQLWEQPDSIETILGVSDPSQQLHQLQQPQHQQQQRGDSNRTPTMSDNTPEQQQQQQEWACPQCTLLNPLMQLHCEACGFLHQHHRPSLGGTATSSAPPPPPNHVPPPPPLAAAGNDDGMRIEIHEVDPRVVRAVTGATSVVAWSLLGGLVAGPVGMVVGGAASAVLAGVHEWQHQQSDTNPNRRGTPPRFTFTSTRFTESPDGGSIVQVTTNAAAGGGARDDGRFRTIVVRAPPGTNIHTHPWGPSLNNNNNTNHLPLQRMTPTDRRILELLLQQHALRMSGGPVDPSTMTYDELLERFGVGTEHRRGASPETIQSLPLFQLDQQGIDSLAVERTAHTCCHICLEDFVASDTLRRLPACAHVFHQHCIDRWLATVAACPVCKHEVTTHVTSS